MKIADQNSSNFLNANKQMRTKIFSHLLDAKRSLTPSHPAHGHIDKAAAELGGVVDNTPDEKSIRDRSADASSGQDGNLTSPGTITTNVNAREAGARQATGSSDIATRSATATLRKDAKGKWQVHKVSEDGTSTTRRDLLVKILYKSAAAMKDGEAKSALEKFTLRFDSLNKRDIDALTEGDWAAVEKLAMGTVPSTGIQFIGGGGRLRTWSERHFGA